MTTTPIVRFGGEQLGGATLYGWDLVSGTAPAEKVFTVTRAAASRVKQFLGTAQALEIETAGDIQRTENIYLLEVWPAGDPLTFTLRLADERWKWPKRWISTSFNIRRATGDTFLSGTNRLENKRILPELQYAKFSLYPINDPKEPWTPEQAIQHVLDNELETPMWWKDTIQSAELQDLTLEGPGNEAVERLLAYFPGASIYLDRSGEAVIYDVLSNEEAGILESLPAPRRGSGIVSVVDKSALRPQKVVVLFTPEIEQKFTYTEAGTRATDTATLQNVAPVTDIDLDVTVDGESFTAARGSYIPLQSLFDAWGAFGKLNRKVSFRDLRFFATKFSWANFKYIWGLQPHVPPDKVNIDRAAACTASWRKTFKIDPRYMHRLAAVRPWRSSLLVVHLGAYAPAEVFCDWTRRPTRKGFARAGDPAVDLGWAVRGYADAIDDASPAPVRVSILNEGAGLFQIAPNAEPFGMASEMWLGYPENGLPKQVIDKAAELYRRWDLVNFEADWKMAVILTVVPGSPNNTNRFWQVEVHPTGDDGPCNGPTVYTRIFPGVMTARFGWRDARASDIDNAIRYGMSWMPEDLLLNKEWVDDVAQAVARRIYEPLHDRPQGNMSCAWQPELEPGGSLRRVSTNMRGGEMETSLTFAAPSQPASFWRYLDASTQRAILMILDEPRPG